MSLLAGALSRGSALNQRAQRRKRFVRFGRPTQLIDEFQLESGGECEVRQELRHFVNLEELKVKHCADDPRRAT